MDCLLSVINNNGCLSFLIDLLGMTLLHFPPMDCHPSATFSNLNSNSHPLLRTFFVINCRWILMAPLGEEVRGCSANSEDTGSQVKGKQQNHLFGNGESFIYSSQAPRLHSDPGTSHPHSIVNIAVPLCPAHWQDFTRTSHSTCGKALRQIAGWLISWPCKPYLLTVTNTSIFVNTGSFPRTLFYKMSK